MVDSSETSLFKNLKNEDLLKNLLLSFAYVFTSTASELVQGTICNGWADESAYVYLHTYGYVCKE